jgi:hypothetical protein
MTTARGLGVWPVSVAASLSARRNRGLRFKHSRSPRAEPPPCGSCDRDRSRLQVVGARYRPHAALRVGGTVRSRLRSRRRFGNPEDGRSDSSRRLPAPRSVICKRSDNAIGACRDPTMTESPVVVRGREGYELRPPSRRGDGRQGRFPRHARCAAFRRGTRTVARLLAKT